MTEESPHGKRTSTRSTRGTKNQPDDFVYYGDKKSSKELKTPRNSNKASRTPKTPLKKTSSMRSKTPARNSKASSVTVKKPPRTPRALKTEVKEEVEIMDPPEAANVLNISAETLNNSNILSETPNDLDISFEAPTGLNVSPEVQYNLNISSDDPNSLNITSESQNLESKTPLQPIILAQGEKEKLKYIEQNMNMGKKGFKRRGRPKKEDYAERKENLLKIKILKEQGQLGDDDSTPIRPPPAKKPRKSPSCDPAPPPSTGKSFFALSPLSSPVTRKQTRMVEGVINPTLSTYSKSYSDRKFSTIRFQKPQIVSPFVNQPTQRPLIVYRPPPPRPGVAPTIRFLKPRLPPLNSNPNTSSKASKMIALKDALFIKRPASAASTSSNGSALEKENIRVPLHVQTTPHLPLVAAASKPPQIVRPQHSASPSIITFANYPNNLLSLEPNVKYCLVNQNGELIYPASELEKNSSELDPSPSPPIQRFIEPQPNYFLTIL